ncbi:MAG: hypothetical protein J3Q66DRAFT_312368 [Benniella sp.]|nr:MAG: hypothetical protein J3Q66DRAFT_312368 [Benniella sp.]
MLHERYWRSQAKRAGRFTEKERSLLETAITTFGEDANWNLIASQVPGRTASQCRNSWNYGRTHHIQRQDEPWTEEDRYRLKRAVERFGTKKWTLISEFVIGKTPGQCRNQWKERLDPTVNTRQWTNREMDRLMERRKVDWKEVAKGMEGRTPQQCRVRFMNHRALYRIKGDY